MFARLIGAFLLLGLAACVSPSQRGNDYKPYCNNQKPDPEAPSQPAKDCSSMVVKGDTPGAAPPSLGQANP